MSVYLKPINIAMCFVALWLLTGCATKAPPAPERDIIFYPPPPQRPRLQFLHAISSDKDLGKESSAFKEFLIGRPEAHAWIGKSYDIASAPGKIFILDRRIRKLLILNLAKRTFNYLKDTRLGALQDPSGIWVTEDEYKYIADMQRKQVVVFDAQNRFVRSYGNETLFAKPVDVAVFADKLFVCDMKRHRIVVMDRQTGAFRAYIGELGKGPGQFNRPTHVIVDASGYLYVNDAFNFRVQRFNPQGQFTRSYGYVGDGLGALARPKGIAVDRADNLYVVDAAFENVQIFEIQTGRLRLFFGGPGNSPGNLYLPAGIHVDHANAPYFANFADARFKLQYLVYVGNMFGPHKLAVYGFGDWLGRSLK